MCVAKGGLLISSGMRDMWSGQGPASPLDCPATDILEFLSTGNELKLLSLGRVVVVGGDLPPV